MRPELFSVDKALLQFIQLASVLLHNRNARLLGESLLLYSLDYWPCFGRCSCFVEVFGTSNLVKRSQTQTAHTAATNIHSPKKNGERWGLVVAPCTQLIAFSFVWVVLVQS
eukprot:1149347-Amphidinium_carterae.1